MILKQEIPHSNKHTRAHKLGSYDFEIKFAFELTDQFEMSNLIKYILKLTQH